MQGLLKEEENTPNTPNVMRITFRLFLKIFKWMFLVSEKRVVSKSAGQAIIKL
jgi:hypothetical protein